jgi:hypothetical protein
VVPLRFWADRAVQWQMDDDSRHLDAALTEWAGARAAGGEPAFPARSGEDDGLVARRFRWRWFQEGCSFRQRSPGAGLPDTVRFDR